MVMESGDGVAPELNEFPRPSVSSREGLSDHVWTIKELIEKAE